ncbi:SNARE domain-containing protein [Cephalotus follicularis]|uniref:SNARE domain-containing protein n=1 Tax=Cephalotus follicularis TaxID=3775 RepID=A0A1Q3CMU5_CEPFO|nr:SNARE domain-containing protein [Cephalotus follicularis]
MIFRFFLSTFRNIHPDRTLYSDHFKEMFGLVKSPLKVTKHNSVDPGFHASSRSNPFDSDDELENKHTLKRSTRTSSEPKQTASHMSTNPFDNGEEIKGTSSSSYSLKSTARNNYKNDFRESGGLENQSVQELENYAVYRSEETTKAVNGCLKIAEDMREDATRTLVMLHHQGEQITRTHQVAADIDHDLSRGEKLLGSLGSMFSKTWKPKKTRPIMGPVMTRDASPKRSGNHLEQREKLGLTPASKVQLNTRTSLPEPTNANQKVEVEKAKQDDALSDLSNILGELKDMAFDMGSEIERGMKAMDPFEDDVDEINNRVRGANERAHRLLRK